MSSLMFQPWMGKEYGKSGYGRLLIIGESHYFYDNVDNFQNFTKKIIGSLGSVNDNDFYISVGELFNPSNYLEIWPKIAFANAIQYEFRESRQPKSVSQIRTIEPAIRAYLNITKPNKVLVCSKLVWDKGLPETIDWGSWITKLEDKENFKEATVWNFNYDGGTCLAMGIHHPGSTRPKFYSSEWKPIVDEFLKM